MIERTVLHSPHVRPRWPASGSLLSRGRLISSQTVQFMLWLLGVALVTFILYLYVLPTSQMNEAKLRIAQLQAQKAALDRQSAELARQISLYTDLPTLERRARQLGMGPPQRAILFNANAVNAAAMARESVVVPSAGLADWGVAQERSSWLPILGKRVRWIAGQVAAWYQRLKARLDANSGGW